MPIDKTAIILEVVKIIPNLIPRPKPPKADYSELIEAIPRTKYPPLNSTILTDLKTQPIEIPRIDVDITSNHEPVEEVYETMETEIPRIERVATACMSCARSHLATIAGGLGEAVRFARGDPQGIQHPEALMRIQKMEEEINILERIDLSPESLQSSPPEEKEVAEEYLPRIRKLRQDIGDIASFEDLEKTAGDASILGQEFRLRALQLKGVDLNPVVELAKKVQRGELTMQEAKERLKEILPEE